MSLAVDTQYFYDETAVTTLTLDFIPTTERNVAVFNDDEEIDNLAWSVSNNILTFDEPQTGDIYVYNYKVVEYTTVKAHLRFFEVYEHTAMAQAHNAAVSFVEQASGYAMYDRTVTETLVFPTNDCNYQFLSWYKPTLTTVERFDNQNKAFVTANATEYTFIDNKPASFYVFMYGNWRLTYSLDSTDYPKTLDHAALLVTADLFQNRTSTVKELNSTADMLINQVALKMV